MKAILVVNLPYAEINAKDCIAKVEIGGIKNNFFYKDCGFIRLKPMPQKKEVLIEKLKNNSSSICYSDCRFVDGWNACLDEILGDTK